jgi:hypothetical protein
MSSELRYLNEAGRAYWRQWLEDLKGEPHKPFPVAMLTNPDSTRRAPGGAAVESRIFPTKFELAKTLAPVVATLRAARLPADYWPGVWDWLAAFHFDSICPPQPNGARKLNDLVRYSFNPAWNRKYRHRIFGPVDLYSRLGDYSRLLIHGEPGSLTDWEEQTASRYQISGNVGVAEALFRLYWDDAKQTPKRGAAPNKKTPGTLRRFGDLVQQFDRTFDLLSINAETILDLLPKEFAPFRK